jgi:hypothetical protein
MDGGTPLSFLRPYVRPILHPRDQTAPYRIIQNVIGFVSKALIGSYAMIEEIALPADAQLLR